MAIRHDEEKGTGASRAVSTMHEAAETRLDDQRLKARHCKKDRESSVTNAETFGDGLNGLARQTRKSGCQILIY